MDEHRLYEAADPVEAEIVSNLLRAHGIETVILGVHGWGGRGDLAVNAYPRLHLQRVGDRPRATALLREYQQADAGPDWRCEHCGEASGARFGLCWQCGAAKPETVSR